MGEINFGSGTGLNNSSTTSGYCYTPLVDGSNILPFNKAAKVDEIKFYNLLTDVHLRIWKGTASGLVFTFDDFTEDVDVDLVGKGTGWLTLTAPTDFAAFAVISATALLFYAHSTIATGTQIARGNAAPNAYGYNAADPPFTGNLTMLVGATTHRFEVNIKGFRPEHQMIL